MGQENEQEHEFEYKLSIAGVGQLGLEQQWPPGLSWSWLAMPVSNRAVLRPRPHPHPTQTQRHSYIQRRAAKTAILNVENGSSKVIKCLQGKSLNLNRPHWCRFSYALTNPHMYHILSNVKWKRWKKLVSGLRWQALRMRHQILGCFPQSLVQSVALKMLSSKSFPFKSRFFCGRKFTFDNWQLRWRTSYLLTNKPDRTSADDTKF